MMRGHVHGDKDDLSDVDYMQWPQPSLRLCGIGHHAVEVTVAEIDLLSVCLER